jgi:hypothetical protein
MTGTEPRRTDNVPRTHYYGDDCVPPHPFPGWCVHCGDRTEEGDDPKPGLCAMCAKAGRGNANIT